MYTTDHIMKQADILLGEYTQRYAITDVLDHEEIEANVEMSRNEGREPLDAVYVLAEAAIDSIPADDRT